MGLSSVKNIEPLDQKKAIELGGEMLGEILVFTFGFAIMASEYYRSATKEQDKQEKAKAEFGRLTDKLKELKTISEIQEGQIHELQKQLK